MMTSVFINVLVNRAEKYKGENRNIAQCDDAALYNIHCITYL